MRRSLLAVVVVALVAVACGDEEPSRTAAPQPAEHNAADVAFLRGMIPHHEQAVVMSDMAATQAGMVEVKELAERIRTGQQREIEQMQEWLSTWDEGAAGDDEHAGHAGHGAHPGMLDPAQLDELRAASGSEFDRLFLTSMIFHHEGAVISAQKVLDEGRHDGVKELARQIVETQEAEIAEMRELLERLGAAPPADPAAAGASVAPTTAPGAAPGQAGARPATGGRTGGQQPGTGQTRPPSQSQSSPTTSPPAGQSPTTQAPAAQSPTTQPPATQAPATQAPTTQPATTTTTRAPTTTTAPCTEEHRAQGHCD